MSDWRSGWQKLPYFDKEQAKILWYHDYYNGPLSGVAVVAGEKCWYTCVDDDDPRGRRYTLHTLSPEEIETLTEHHTRFVEHVARPQTEWHKFYDWAKGSPLPDYSKNAAIGWFGPELSAKDERGNEHSEASRRAHCGGRGRLYTNRV